MKSFLFKIILFFLISSTIFGLPVFRISVENTASHVQARAIQKFADIVAEKTKGELIIELYHSAELYRDSDVIKAIPLGKVEMVVPGTWHIQNFVPEVGIFPY